MRVQSLQLLLAAGLVVLTVAQQHSAGPAPAPAPDVVVTARTVRLEPFRAVQICVPFNVLLLPTPALPQYGNYSLTVEAEGPVLDAVTVNVVNDTLQLEVVEGFATSFPIKLVIYLPEDELEQVSASATLSDVTVGPGFDVPVFIVSSAFTTGSINVFNLTATEVGIRTSGTGQVFINGTFSNVSIVAGGTANVLVLGIEEAASIDLGGAANTVLGFTTETGIIYGVATGANRVTYNEGECLISSVFVFGSPCVQQQPLVVPSINPIWSCGLNVTGDFLCPAGGLESALEDASVGTSLGSTIPSFLSGTAVTSTAKSDASAAAAAQARTGQQALGPVPSSSPPTLIPAAPTVPKISPPSGAVTAITPSGTTVTNIGTGERTAVAEGSGSQTAIAGSASSPASLAATQSALAQQQQMINSLGVNIGRKMLQTGNAALDLLNSLQTSNGFSTSLAETRAVPSTYTSTGGPGSIACSYVNGKGGCTSGTFSSFVQSASLPPSQLPGATQVGTALPPLVSGGSSLTTPVASTTSSSTSVSQATSTSRGTGTSYISTSGPGASACSSINGKLTCSPNAVAETLPPSGSAASPQAAAAPTPQAPVVFTAGQAIGSNGALLEAEMCRLTATQTLDIFSV